MLQLKLVIGIVSLVSVANCGGCLDINDKEISGFCYTYIKQKMTFEDARDFCHYKSPVTPSYLAYMQNQFTANFLASYGRSIFGSDEVFWIGLSRGRNWQPWTWDNGYQIGSSWSNFDNNLSYNYVAERVSNAKWTTFPDNSTHYFVCSYDPTDLPIFTPRPPTTSRGPTTTTTTTTSGPTTTVTFPPCSKPFHGRIAVAYEMTKLPQTQGVLNFIQKYLFNSANYKFQDGTSQAINVPYPDSGVYENIILHYPDATSAEMLSMNIDQLYSEVMVLTNAQIGRAYEYILEERDPGNATTNVLITVGVDDMAVFDGSATSYLHQLQNEYGFRSIVVSIGPNENYLSHLAESDDWYFTATEANSQWIADQISRIICHF